MNHISIVFISNRTSFRLINSLLELLRRYLYLVAGQFRYIVTLESLHILFWVFLRQDKGFAGLSFRIEISYVKSGIRTVVASGTATTDLLPVLPANRYIERLPVLPGAEVASLCMGGSGSPLHLIIWYIGMLPWIHQMFADSGYDFQ